MCRRPIGSGNIFCVNSSCCIRAHEGVEQANIPKGQLYVQMHKGVIFAVSNIGSFSLVESILVKLKEKSQTLETWNQIFRTGNINPEEAVSGFVMSEAFYRYEEVNSWLRISKPQNNNNVNQAVGISFVKRCKSLFTSKQIVKKRAHNSMSSI